MRYTYNDFIAFSKQHDQDLNIDGDVIWFKNKPIPTSLVRKIFFEADSLLKIFFNHMRCAVLVSIFDARNATDFLYLMPNECTNSISDEMLWDIWNHVSIDDKYLELDKEFVRCSGLRALGNFTWEDFHATSRHKGKKYDRLYVPETLKAIFKKVAPHMNQLLGKKNGDMYGNVIADFLGVYRSGYADVFTRIFNRYLDFKLTYFGSLDPSRSSLGLAKVQTYGTLGKVVRCKAYQSVLWEPRLGDDGGIDAFIKGDHPLFLSDEINHREKLDLLLLALSHEEMHLVSNKHKEALESFRLRVTNTLREFTQSCQKQNGEVMTDGT